MAKQTSVMLQNGKIYIADYYYQQKDWIEVDPNQLPTRLLVGTGIALCEAILNLRLNRLGGLVNIVQTPDWSGGYDFRIDYPSEELGDFEYVENVGSPRDLIGTYYMSHKEPFHEMAYDKPVLFEDLVDEFLGIRTI